MKRWLTIFLSLILIFLCGCAPLHDAVASAPPVSAPTQPSEPPITEPPATLPEHSDLYLSDYTVDDIIRFFNEVCLDAEFTDYGDPSRLQKWDGPIDYYIHGNPTQKDLEVIDDFVIALNKIEGFPGMLRATHEEYATLQIYFCTQQELIGHLGENFYGTDGGVTFWYNGKNEIYNAIICYRNDIDQHVRNSVILEEIYNGLGPIQDTDLRKDSIIYSGYSTPQQLTAVDALILKLLYHPEMKCGMSAQECEAVIRTLYY